MSNFSLQANIHEGINKVRLFKDYKYIKGFSLLNFQGLNEFYFKSNDNETGLLILQGSCDITVNNKVYRNLGLRKNVFSGSPTGVYIPIETEFTIKSQDAKIALCRAKCSEKTEPAIVTQEMVKVMYAGKDNWKREVRIIIGPDSPSVNLILGETINPPGNWSGTPPARHEKNNLPHESSHEELYYFKVDKPQGWGIERIFSRERNVNKLIYLEENTVTFMPWGYHQVVAAPCYTLYYMFFLAGEGKELVQFEDPIHNWIKNI